MILENRHLKVTFTPYGASIQSIIIKALNREVVYGYLNELDYQTNNDYLGCIVGRSAGRIRNATLYHQQTYVLTKNFNNHHTLHGGGGLHNKYFDYEIKDNSIIFKRHSPHLEDGFFGDCDIKVIYELIENRLILHLLATTKTTAYINLTNHVAFNLNEDKDSDILNHKLYINADQMIQIDEAFMPYQIVKVNEVFDFRRQKRIDEDIYKPNEQLFKGQGYDHPFILNGHGLRRVSILEVEDLRLKLSTTQPCLVVYSGNFMPDGLDLISGKSKYRGSIALEAQGIPNNQEFNLYKNDNIITKENPLNETIIWKFETLK